MTRAATAAAVLLLVVVAGARAAKPVTLTTLGNYPQLAVDGSGNAHIVWTTDSSGTYTMTYCKIPDHGTKCAITHTFPLGQYSGSEDARIVLGPAPGEVVVFSDTGVFPAVPGEGYGDGIAVWVSMDGGETFNAGALGGGYDHTPGEHFPDLFLGTKPSFGPGGFSVSMLDDEGYYEDIPVNAGPAVGSNAVPANTEDTELFDDHCGGYGDTSVAMINSTTPIASCEAGTPGAPTALEYRIATGQGDIDNASTGSWGTVGSFPIGGGTGDYNNLVGGPRGVYATYSSPGDNLAVRHLSGAGFGPPTTIAPTARPFDFSQDATGNLYAAYFHDIDAGDSLDVATSVNGTTWTKVPLSIGSLQGIPPSNAQVGGCAAATANQTGNGWVVWPEAGTVPGNGRIIAESFGDSPCGGDQGSSACPTQLTVGVATLLSGDGCFAKGKDGTYTTSSETELNGMMIDPSGSATADATGVSAEAGTLTINPANHTITSSAPALVRASNIPLVKQTLDWLLPSAAGTITDLAGKYASPVAFDPSSLGGHVLGFAINGLVTPTLNSGGTASLSVNAVMPSPIGGFIGTQAPTDDLSLTTSNSVPGGLSLAPGSVHIDIPDVSLGLAELKPFDIDYDSDPSVFDGHIKLLLPVLDNSLDTHFRFEQGKFVEGDADLDLGSDFMLFPDVFLQHIDLHVAGRRGNPCAIPATDADGPTSIGGALTVALGPIADGTAVLSLQGNANYTFPEQSCNQPGVFAMTGTGALFGIPVENGHASFTTNGDINLGGGIAIGDKVLGLSADVEGDIQAHSPYDFYAQGSADVYVGGIAFGPTVVASNLGIGACLSPLGYVKYKWHGSLDGGLLSCDLDDLKPAGFSADLSRPQATPAITVPRHESSEEFVITGSGGAPQVTLSGPGGAQVTTPALPAGQTGTMTESSTADVAVSGSLDQTAIKLNHPAAGRWTIAAQPGSSPISGVSVAHALPPVSVKAQVLAGTGRKRVVAYRNTPAPGRAVTLIETGAGAIAHPLGTVSGAHGQVRFTAAPGPAGRRTILAEVTERGMAVGKPFKVASYVAPGPPQLTRPRHVTVTRRGRRIVIAWDRVVGAHRYVVRAMLADGRALVQVVPRSRRSVKVAAVSGVDDGKVMVAALDAVNRPGPIATAKLAAVKPTCLRPKAKRGKLVCAAVRPKHTKPTKPTKHRRSLRR